MARPASASARVVTYADGLLEIHDPRATLQVVEWALRMPSAPHDRRWYLSLASACGHWLCGSRDPVWPAPDVPIAAVEHWGISVGRLAVLHGDEDYLGALASYGGIHGLRRRDALDEVLWRPSAAVLRGLDTSPHPMGYLVATMQHRIAAQARVDPQAHMVSLNDLRRHDDPHGNDERRRDDELRHLVLTTPGIDTAEYLGALRATGKAADLRLAADVESWLGGAGKRELGDARYQAMLSFLRQPRSRAIGQRARGVFTRAVGGAMAPPTWYYSTGTQLDSVVHRANARLIR